MSVESEYERLKNIFSGAAPDQLALLDHVFLEAARIKSELDRMNEIVSVSGRVRINPKNPAIQKVLPVSKELEKARASYAHYISVLSKALGSVNSSEDNDELDDYR